VTKEKISEYDASADGNTDVNGVNIAEGCAPSGINNAIREVMGALKRFETGADGDSLTVGGNLVVSGSTTANTLSATVINATGSVTFSGTTTANTFSTDLITEKTSAAGVTVDGVLLKDTTVTANTIKASGTASSQGEVQLFEDTDNGTNYVALKAPASIASDVTFVLPDADGTSGQALVTNGSGTLSFGSAGGGNYVLQAFTSPATWTKPAGIKAVKVTVVGGGGDGGTAAAATPQFVERKGAGGGGGGTSIEYIPAPSIPGPVSVTTGAAGGTSSFGPFCSATGGSVGGALSGTGVASGGVGGAGSGGDINMPGGTGQLVTIPGQPAGAGGGSIFGVGGVAVQGTNNGVAGGNFGGGGSGGSRTGPVGSTSEFPGGAGSAGIVIVEEFY